MSDRAAVRELAAALYRLEWQADLYATPRGGFQRQFEGRAERLLRSDWLRQHDAEVWEAGFESGATWQPSGPSGVPSDPPRNPHQQEVSGE